MKKIIGLVLLIFIASRCFGVIKKKDPRKYIYSILTDPSLVWERDDNYCGFIEIAGYPKQARVLKVEREHIMTSYPDRWDTTVTFRGLTHTSSFYDIEADFDKFYNGYDYIINQ